jgi:hypothetical protein
LELTSGRAWFLLVSMVLFGGCVMPAGCVAVLVYAAVHRATQGVTEADRRAEEQEQRREAQREGWRQEQQQWEEVARAWRAPPADAGPARLFPERVGTFRLERQDDRADVHELGIRAPGWRAVYRGLSGTVEVFAYRADRAEKLRLLGQAQAALAGQAAPADSPFGEPARPNARGAGEVYFSYEFGPPGAAGQYGTLWWQPDWLFLARSASPLGPGAFLQAYLPQISEPAPARGAGP